MTAPTTPNSGSLEGYARLPTTTVLLPRLPIFAPTFDPDPREGNWFECAAGRCRVDGTLGQRHQACLEAILHFATHRLIHHAADGTVDYVEVLVDPAKVRRAVGRKGSDYNFERLKKLMADLQKAIIDVEHMRNGVLVTTHGALIERYEQFQSVALLNPLTRRIDRHPWCVRLGKAYILLAGIDIPRFWDPRDFQSLSSGIAQAVARWLWTQINPPNGGWKLDTVIQAVTPSKIGGDAMRNRRREIRCASDCLAELGITVTGDGRLLYDGRLARRAMVADEAA